MWPVVLSTKRESWSDIFIRLHPCMFLQWDLDDIVLCELVMAIIKKEHCITSPSINLERNVVIPLLHVIVSSEAHSLTPSAQYHSWTLALSIAHWGAVKIPGSFILQVSSPICRIVAAETE